MKTHYRSWGTLLLLLAIALAPNSYATTFGANLVTNGDAETGTLGGWTATTNAGAVTIINAYLGENAQTLHGKVFDIWDGTANPATFEQTINISDVQTSVATGLVSFAFSVEAFSWEGALVVYMVEELGASNNVLNAHTSGTISLSPQKVNYIYGVGTIDSSACTWTSTHLQAAGLDASTTQLRITVYGKTSNTATDYVDFDNFELTVFSVPTVTTTAVTTYGKNIATLGGNVTANNGATATARGVVYSSTDVTPTIGETGVTQDANGSGLGVFSGSIASLSAGTLYYVRAYATNSAGTSYGSVVSFTTTAEPAVTTAAVTTYGKNSATLGGDVTADNGATVTARGVVYSSTDVTPTIGEAGVMQDANGSGAGVFSESIASLSAGTLYYARAYATNSAGTSYGSVVSFTTTADPAVTTAAVTTYGTNSATLGGDVTAENGATVTARGVVYSSTDVTPTIGEAGVTQEANGSGLGVFSGSIASLSAGTLYYARAYATNSAGTSYGDVVSFTTISVPTITKVEPPAAGTYALGDALVFTATFSEAVTVTGTPYIELTIGDETKQAVYVSGSNSTELVFRYVLQSGDVDVNGIAMVASIDDNGGSIQNTTEGAVLSFSLPAIAGIMVDAAAPTIKDVTPPAAGTYALGDELIFTATFSEVVTVTGSPFMSLTMGSSTKQATYVSGSNSTALKFRYVLVAGDADANGIAVAGALTAGSGMSIEDAAGNAATLTYTSPTTSGIVVDAEIPTITNVAPPAAGTYKTGDALVFTATFSEVVKVTGSPYIAVTIGSTTRQVAYASGSNSTTLTFRYVLVAADSDADGISAASSVVANGGSITDGAGNAAALALGALTTTAILVKNIPSTSVATAQGPVGYSLAYEASTGAFHMQVPYAARHAEIILLDAAGHRMASKSLGSVAGNMDVSFAHVPASWSLAVLRVDGAVRATWRGGYSLR